MKEGKGLGMGWDGIELWLVKTEIMKSETVKKRRRIGSDKSGYPDSEIPHQTHFCHPVYDRDG